MIYRRLRRLTSLRCVLSRQKGDLEEETGLRGRDEYRESGLGELWVQSCTRSRGKGTDTGGTTSGTGH